MKNPLYIAFALLLFCQFALAQKDSIPPRKEYFTSRATQTPKIDGLLDDETWKTAAMISDFKQNFPNYNAEPTQTNPRKERIMTAPLR